jgi:hypothetical protein
VRLAAVMLASLGGGAGIEVKYAGIEQVFPPFAQTAFQRQKFDFVDGKAVAFHGGYPLKLISGMMKVYCFIMIV